jgi:hypothetical protein
MSNLGVADLLEMAAGRVGEIDVACPICGPYRRAAINQRRKVLRLYVVDRTFVGYICARCGVKGHSRDDSGPPPDPLALERARRAAAARKIASEADRLRRARLLWKSRQAPSRTPVERYLRDCRRITAPIPATIGFLPARDEYPPAMITAFAFAHESQPGVLAVSEDAVRGVHITRLLPDGSGKESGEAKLTFGPALGTPLVLAPMGDLLGLAITEGIEDALSIHESTGLGAWAAGCAARLPSMADAVPDIVDFVTVVADQDRDGQRHARSLVNRLRHRGLRVDRIDLYRAEAA